MITDQLYPTVTSWGVGTTTNQYTDEHTNELTYLGTVSVDSYFLGWAEYDDLPTFMGHCTGELDGDILTITEDVNESRVPCGYTFVGQYSYVDYPRGTFLKDGVRTGSAHAYLINQVHPEYYANTMGNFIGGYITLYFLAVVYDAGNEVVYQNGYGLQYYDYSTFFPFIHGDSTMYANSVGGYGTFELSADMFADGTEMVALLDPTTHEANGYTARLFMVGYSIPTKYYRSNGGSTDMVHAAFFAKMSAGEHEYCINALGNAGTDWNLGWYSSSIGYIDANGNYTHFENFAGVSGTVNLSQIRGNELAFTWDGGVLAVCGSWREGFPIGVFALCSLEDVRKSIDSHFRVCPGNYVDSYVLNQSYATDVTEEDQFLLRLKTGNITNPTFKDSLREWQYSDFQSDEFTEEDIPVPTPVEPDTPSEEPENVPDVSGDNIPNQESRTLGAPMKFITQYVLDANLLRSFGNALWTSWLTPNTDVWKNFLFSLAADTGTFDIGAAMNFVISLRAYPFDIPSIALNYMSNSDGIYLGTGHTNFVPGNIAVLNSTIGALYAGECSVTKENMEVYYDDFRDIYNCSVIVFLPFCGTVELNPTEVVGSTLKVWYFIDYQSGGCTAIVRRVWNGKEYNLAAKSGQIGFMLPITATNAGQLAATFAGDAVGVAKTLSGFFFDAAKSQSDNLLALGTALFSKNTGVRNDGKKSMNIMADNTFETSLEIGESGVNTGLSLANQALNVLSRSGIDMPFLSGGSGAESMMFPDKCYVQIRRGKYAKPLNYPHSQAHLNGSSNTISYYAGKFGNYPSTNDKGLCKFTGVDTTGLTCHDDERAEIVALLESGVYI